MVAFFSGVDIDDVLRKETNIPCTTPSNLIPIPPGEVLDIHQVQRSVCISININSQLQIGEKTNWTLQKAPE